MMFLFLRFILLGYFAEAFADSDILSESAMLERIGMIESRYREDVEKLTELVLKLEEGHKQSILKLKGEMTKMKNDMESAEKIHHEDVMELKNTVVILNRKIESQTMQLNEFKNTEQKHKIKVPGDLQQNEKYANSTKERSEIEPYKEDMIPVKRALQYGGTDIAFTSYLDHGIDNIGADQVIVFDKVLLNEGNGYNKYTGVFTAPVSGIYHFNFVIGERDANQMFVHLVVNNVIQLDAVTESIQGSHDTQGGNAANLKVDQGDTVYIKHYIGGHIGAYGSLRATTFSGFLVYPTESTSSIVGK